MINVRPIGVLVMEDNSGKDEKIIAVPSPNLTQRYAKVHDYSDLPEITLKQIAHFFEHYKDLEPASGSRSVIGAMKITLASSSLKRLNAPRASNLPYMFNQKRPDESPGVFVCLVKYGLLTEVREAASST